MVNQCLQNNCSYHEDARIYFMWTGFQLLTKESLVLQAKPFCSLTKFLCDTLSLRHLTDAMVAPTNDLTKYYIVHSVSNVVFCKCEQCSILWGLSWSYHALIHILEQPNLHNLCSIKLCWIDTKFKKSTLNFLWLLNVLLSAEENLEQKLYTCSMPPGHLLQLTKGRDYTLRDICKHFMWVP